MAAPRKTTQPVNTESGEEQAEQTTAATESEQSDLERAGVAPSDLEQAKRDVALLTSTTEQVTLTKEAGGHKAGATITVTHGAAEYLREQGYVDDGEDADED